jgi:hypothetical protein
VGVALKKLNGVETVQVKLNSGLAMVHLKSGNRIQLQDLRKAVESHGFSTGGAIIKFTGKINSENNKTWVEVSGIDEILYLNEVTANSIRIENGKALMLKGKIEAPNKDSKNERFFLTELNTL